MTTNSRFSMEGGCACKHVRYRMEAKPLIVHCCHCYCELLKPAVHNRTNQTPGCQRETGSAFVLNAIIEASNVTHLGASPVLIETPSESGGGQVIARCPKCSIAVWSHYSAGPVICFLRVGTLDNPHKVEPDAHIYIDSKLPWVRLPEGARSFGEYYEIEDVWSKESLERRKLYLPEVLKWRAEQKREPTSWWACLRPWWVGYCLKGYIGQQEERPCQFDISAKLQHYPSHRKEPRRTTVG